ncbi:hypothetical protein MGN70_007171 [Eutypa lata]|nr:hypothetical protein MGN70_007171 [Eutypa lata]
MVKLTKILLDTGVGVDIDPSVEPTIEYYPSVLHMASMLDHSDIVEILLARGATSKAPAPMNYASFQAAATRGHIDVVQKYLDHDASHIKDRQPYIALWAASEWGPTPDDYRIWTPLAIACREGYPKTVEALLVGGADANAIGPYGVDTALWFPACDNLNVDCVRVMLKYNADPNHHLFNPLLLIEMENSRYQSARLLPICDALRDGVRPINLNTTNENGQTALMIASQSVNLDLVEWLLKSGADTDVLDYIDASALYYVIRDGCVDVVAALLKKGRGLV